MFRRRPLARMAVRTTVVAGTAMAVGAHVANKSAAAGAEQAQAAPAAAPEYVEAAPVAAPAPAAAPVVGLTDDAIAELTKLAGLKDAGVLTQEEFDAEKAKILA